MTSPRDDLPALDVVVARLRAAGCVFAEDEAALLLAAAATSSDLEDMVGRRVAGFPLEPILGWAELCGVRVAVDPGVFVPRARTALLVEEAARLAPRSPVVVDLCCGSGALGVALAHLLGTAPTSSRRPDLTLWASDVEPAAVACARRNVEPLGGHVVEGDLDASLPDHLARRVDLLLANVPYVPTDAIALMPPEARDHEPAVTLDGGADGLDVLRRVAAAAPRWLAPGGHVLVEASTGQVPDAVAAFEHHGLTTRVVTDDERGATVLVARRTGTP
ncbi:release factor glutamine methyltransferase [Sediminihabitans luteus]|uniref:peptide chain release factor N(5)-glutamine methyltransferase n=1 Tax=Sediminihabitans luteus TaxID=1138585 RepID=A0A2M9CYZ5_9CELL|nr:putative protein N(5)-glutamine methyltransferase [Sediminihabitans luteus]PJJ77149.1 release factor glutamine methyltransferase [Sediminihabitans luteus]GII98597.1 methylase [Sediminihabitans luteus]